MAAMQQQAYLEDDDFHMDMHDDHDPAMQEFFRQIEEMRDTATQVQRDVDKVKKLQNDILSSPTVDPKHKSVRFISSFSKRGRNSGHASTDYFLKCWR